MILSKSAIHEINIIATSILALEWDDDRKKQADKLYRMTLDLFEDWDKISNALRSWGPGDSVPHKTTDLGETWTCLVCGALSGNICDCPCCIARDEIEMLRKEVESAKNKGDKN